MTETNVQLNINSEADTTVELVNRQEPIKGDVESTLHGISRSQNGQCVRETQKMDEKNNGLMIESLPQKRVTSAGICYMFIIKKIIYLFKFFSARSYIVPDQFYIQMKYKKAKEGLSHSTPRRTQTSLTTLVHLCAPPEVLRPHLAGLGIQDFLEGLLVLCHQQGLLVHILEAQEGRCHHDCREIRPLLGDHGLLLILLNPEVKRGKETLSADIPTLLSTFFHTLE